MSPAPSSRHKSSFLSFFFFFILFILPPSSFAATSESSLLFSWLQTSPSPPSALSDWNAGDASPCNWTSIACSPAGHVSEITIQSLTLQLSLSSLNLSAFPSLTKLILSDVNLTGDIPPEIGRCGALRVLDLSSNALTGRIPATIGNLAYLEDLILNSNQLTGSIPADVTGCRGLRNLLLFDNHLSGTIPPELGKLSGLEVLRAGGNKDIVGGIPPELSLCSKFTVLGLADTRVSGPLPAELGRLGMLQTLSIYTTMVSGEIPPELGNCSELVNIFLYENSLSGPIPSSLGRLQKLEQLMLWQNGLTGSIPAEIGNCSSLTMIDVSLNYLSGAIPASLGRLSVLEELMISNNNVSGSIPTSLANATSLVQLQLDTNQISGLIPPELGRLSQLTVFFAWQNNLEGSIPASLSSCGNLQALDLSHNALTGTLPSGLFQFRNLTKLLLISNDISGTIPAEIGNCSSLVRLRLGGNRITGGVPKEIGKLKNLNFLDLASNRISGPLPAELGDCTELQMIDLSNNSLEAVLPSSISSISGLQVLDISRNQLSGQIPASLARLVSLNKLILSNNALSGSIPSSLARCSSLQLLDLSCNDLSGPLPAELGKIETLEIALNLSWNRLTGPVPPEISSLSKLSVLDLSHNSLDGSLAALAALDNLVSLNISYNNFTGDLPDNKLFHQMSFAELAGNKGLCSSSRNSCFSTNVISSLSRYRSKKLQIALGLLVALTVTLFCMGIFAVIRSRKTIKDDDSELGDSWPWQFTPFQKLSFSIEQILKCLVEGNVIGKGYSGVVYRADIGNGEVIAVKKLWPVNNVAGNDDKSGVRDSFSAEVKTLGTIRHKNIVRFLGCCWNRNTKLLMYDYMPNGSLGSLLHERCGSCLDWEPRYRILLGAAQGLAYLHHDCVPPIVHRDIKANNILVGLDFEAYIADFGLAKLVEGGDFARSSNTVAGSYGYIAPEYGYMMKITEKSDVYSYGVVVLEVLTGKQPIDPTIPEGQHVVDWVRQRRGSIQVLDRSLLSRPESQLEEMRQALGIALLCVNSSPEERPTMKDVAAMLKEIKHERDDQDNSNGKVEVSVNNLRGSPSSEEKHGATSSGMPKLGGEIDNSNNTSFSASSLLYSSCSHTQ